MSAASLSVAIGLAAVLAAIHPMLMIAAVVVLVWWLLAGGA